MREVSCRVLGVWEHVANERGLDYGQMVAGLPVSLAQLRDENGWIDWDVLVEIVSRFEREVGHERMLDIGRAAIQQEVLSPLRRVAGLALGLPRLYQVAMRWQLPLLHRNVLVKLQTLDPCTLRVEISVPPHFRGSAAWFRLLQGGLQAVPTTQGLPYAAVDAEITPHRAVYRVALPGRPVRFLSRVTTWLRDPAVVELERQVNELRRIDRERSRLEDALRERERMFSNLIANLSGMVYRGREDLRFDFVSERCRELTGYGPEELVEGRVSYASLVHPSDLPGLREKRQVSLRSGQPASNEYRLRTRAGETRWMLDVARGIHDADGRIVGIEGFVTDVTARKQLEEDLAQARRVEGIGRLAGGIAHDFNNLLTVILGSVELAQVALKEGPALAYIGHVRAAAERAATLTQQLLAFARKQVIEPRIVDLNALVLGMSSLLSRALIEDIEMKTLLSRGLWTVEVDPGQFEQVLLNLAINARDAMPQGGVLTLETANMVLEARSDALPGLAPGHYVMLSVSDTGTGMTEEVRARAFEPFFTTKDVGKGTGLGLASSHGIVQQAGGHILLSSELGRGTIFRIYLPRAVGIESPIEHTYADEGRGPPQRATILVVEDHDMVREMIVHTLETQGYTVLESASGSDAFHMVAHEGCKPDLLLVDVVMPHMKGTELASRLLELRPGIPVIYMSGHSDDHQMHAATRASDPSAKPTDTTRSFLQKPFTSTTLVRGVREVLTSARKSRAEGDGDKGRHLRIVKH